jgi:hypothetical protein
LVTNMKHENHKERLTSLKIFLSTSCLLLDK